MSKKEQPHRQGGRVLPLAYYGHPVLRKKAEPVGEITEEVLKLIDDMVETMFDGEGMGLAAPQINRSLRLFITCVPEEGKDGDWVYPDVQVYINPELTQPGDETWVMDEGCLSIPNARGAVERPLEIHLRATNEHGEEFEQHLTGWQARCVMHENDHLNGVLFPDRMHPKERREIDVYLKKLKKEFKKR